MLSQPSRQHRRTALRISSGTIDHDRGGLARVVQLALVAHAAGNGDLQRSGADARSGQAAGIDFVAHGDAKAQLGLGGAIGAGEAVIQQHLGARARSAAYAPRAAAWIRSSVAVTASKDRWAWPSTMPGIRVMPLPSITWQPACANCPGTRETARTRLPSTSTSPVERRRTARVPDPRPHDNGLVHGIRYRRSSHESYLDVQSHAHRLMPCN